METERFDEIVFEFNKNGYLSKEDTAGLLDYTEGLKKEADNNFGNLRIAIQLANNLTEFLNHQYKGLTGESFLQR